MPQALPLMAQPDLASQVNAVEQDGYVYLPGVLDEDQTAELRAHMDRLQPNPESFDRGLQPERDGFINRHVNNAFNRDPHFVQFLDYPGVIEIAEALHGANCHVIGMTSWITGPGRPESAVARRLAAAGTAGGRDGRPAGAHSGVHLHCPLLPRRPDRGARPHPLRARQPPRRASAQRRLRLARAPGTEHPVQTRATW